MATAGGSGGGSSGRFGGQLREWPASAAIVVAASIVPTVAACGG